MTALGLYYKARGTAPAPQEGKKMSRYNSYVSPLKQGITKNRRGISFSGQVVIVVIIIGFIIAGLFLNNFKNNCEEQGGSVGLIFSGEGGFKCSGSDGNIIDVF